MTFEEKTISSERIYEGAILNLRRDKVEVINGRTSYREIVEHNGGVAMIAVKDDGKVIMIKQFRKPIHISSFFCIETQTVNVVIWPG